MPRIEVYRRGKRTQELDVPREGLVIGRDVLARVKLDDKLVSRRHARVVVGDGAWTVEDLETKNGTFVNGVREYRRALVDGDRIEIGSFVLVFRQAQEERVPKLVTPAEDGPAPQDTQPTQHVPPKEVARVREEARAMLGPHLVLEGQANQQFYPLKRAETVVGEGAQATHRLDGSGRDEAASFEFRPDGSCVVKRLGWFSSMKVNGAKASEVVLADGDRVELGRLTLVFRKGAGLKLD